MFRFWARVFAAHLEEEIQYLRQQLNYERDRANRAVDELIHIRVGANPVSVPAQPLPETLVEKLLKDTEFTMAGETE